MYHEWGFAVSGENVPKWCGFSYTHLYILFSWKNKPIVNSKERHTTCILWSYFFPASFYLLLLCYPYKYNFKSYFYFWHIFYRGTTWKRNNLQSINKINAPFLFTSQDRQLAEIAASPVKVCSVGTAWLDLALFRQFLPNIGIFT